MRTISSTGNRRRTARNRVLSPARAPRSNFSDIALSASLLVYLALQIYLTSSLDATATPSPVGPPSFRTIERPSNSLLATGRHGSPTDSETSEAEGSLDHIQHSRVDYPSIGMRGLQSTTCLSSISFPPPDDGTAFTLGRDDSTFYLMSVTPDVDNSHFYGVGVLDVTASHSSFVVVLYFNASLGVEWSKRIPTGTAQLATTTFLLTSGVLTSNGFAFPYFANFNTASGGQVLVAEFTRDGVMTWSAVFGSAGGDEYGYQLACAPGTGDLYVVGTAPSPDGTERGGGFVAKLSPSGQLMWFTTVTVGAMNGVVVGDSGDVFISGFDSMSSTTSSTSTLLAKLDPDGTVMWANVYMHALSGISTELGPLSLSPTSGYIASSGRFRDTQSVLSGSIVVVFNQSGGVVWSRYLNSSGSADALLLTAWAPDGTLVSCGQTFIQPVGDEQVLCVRFSAAGELLWSFVTGGRGIDFGNGMLFTKDGGMVVVGFTTSYGVGKFNGFIIRTESYAGVPVSLGAISVINTTSVWPTVTANVTSMRLTDSLSLFSRLNISAAPFITSTLNQSVVLPVTLSRTALTYTLNRQAFPSVPNALLLFPWTYQLPHSPYIGVPGNSLSVDVLPFSTNTNWISLTRSGITASLIGVPIFTEQSNEPYSVSLQYSAVILGVGLHTFPPITVAMCVTTSFPGRFDLLQLDTFLEGQLPAYTTGLSVLNGSKLLAGSLHVSSGPTTASLALLSPRGDYEWLWNLYELSSLDASDHSTFLALALTANDSAIAVGVANGNIEAVVTKLSLSHQISTSYTFHGVATSVIGLPDGSAMIGGYSVMAVDGYDAGLVLRLSQTGDLMWSRLYSGWGTHVYVHTMCVSSPNTTVVGGYTTTSVKDDTGALLFQITWDGDITWSEVFGGLGNDTLESVHSLPIPIGVVFTGSTSSVGAGGLDVLIGCALVNGSMCWLSVFGGPRDDAGSSVYVDDMGGITVTGYISSFDSAGFGGQDIVIASLYGDGSLAWALDVGTDSDDVGNAVLSYDAVVGVSVLGTSSHLNPPGPVVVVCSANGTMSPNVAVGHATVTNQLGFALWDEAFWLSSTLSSFASDPSFLELTAAPEAVSVNGHALTESLDFFNLPLLPPPVCQVPFAKPFNLSLSSAIGLIAQFVSVVEQGAVSLPSWLQVTSTSVLIGTPLGPIRGFYSLVLTVSAGSPSAFQTVTFTLNVTNTAPFYEPSAPHDFTLPAGPFYIPFGSNVSDAEGDSVGEYTLSDFNGRPPNPLISINQATGVLTGYLYPGMLSLNISFVDSFGAVGWTLITINQTSGTSFNAWAFFKKHVRVLLSLMLLAIIIPFSLCWRFHTAAKHLYGTSQFAKLYLRLTDQSRNDLGVDRDLMQRREDIMSKISTIDDPASDFHHEQIQANVDEFCRSIVRVGCLSSETATPVDIISQLELYGCIQRLFTLVKDRLEHCPVLPDDRLLINTRRVIGYTNSILEAILVIVGHQYSHVPAPPSLLRYILLAPWTWLQKCFRSAENGADHHLRLSIDYDLRAELLKTLRASVFSLVGVFGIIPGLQFLISYRTLAIDCQLDILFGLELLREGILHIPDSESRMSLCTRSMGHLCSISKLLADVTDLLVTSSSWFHLYLTAAITLKELSSQGSRITELHSFQEHGYRSIVLSCWGSSRLPACSRVCRKITCGRVPLSDWKLVYGLLKLFGDALLTASDEVFAEGIQGSDSEPNSQRLTVSFIKAQSRTCHCAFGGIWKSIEEVAKQLISTYSPRQGSSVDVGASSVLHGMSTPNEHVRDVFAAVSPPSHSEQPLLGEENLKVSSDVFISVTPNPMDEVLADVLTPAPRPHDADGKQLPGFPPLPRLRAVRGSVSGSAGTPTPSPSPSPLAPDEIRRASPANEVVILQPATAPIVGNGRPLVMLRHVMHPPPRLQPVPVVHPPQLPNQLTTPPAEPECPSPRRK